MLKTDQFIDFLAQNAGPAVPRAPRTSFGLLAFTGLLGLAVLAIWAFHLASSVVMGSPSFLIKEAFLAGLALSLLPGLRLSLMPDSLRITRAQLLCAVLPPALWLLAMTGLAGLVAVPELQGLLQPILQLPPDEALAHGDQSCTVSVLLLALPLQLLLAWPLRQFLPTRVRLVGLVSGLFAGALAGLAYGISCEMVDPGFVLAWYGLGILASGVAGGLAAPRLLRWR